MFPDVDEMILRHGLQLLDSSLDYRPEILYWLRSGGHAGYLSMTVAIVVKYAIVKEAVWTCAPSCMYCATHVVHVSDSYSG
jgi:hypothetical protein